MSGRARLNMAHGQRQRRVEREKDPQRAARSERRLSLFPRPPSERVRERGVRSTAKPRRATQVARESATAEYVVDQRSVSIVHERAVQGKRVYECVCRDCECDVLLIPTRPVLVPFLPSGEGREKENWEEKPSQHRRCAAVARVQACCPNRRTRTTPAGTESRAG